MDNVDGQRARDESAAGSGVVRERGGYGFLRIVRVVVASLKHDNRAFEKKINYSVR